MTSRRAICVSRDRSLRGVIEPALASAGIAVEHSDGVPEDLAGAALVIVDRATRQIARDRLAAATAPVVIVGDDLGDDDLIAAMLEAPVSHVVADPADRDLGIMSEKLVSGDLFGVEKYLAGDTAVSERTITGDADRRNAIGEVCAWAEAIGTRRPVLHRLASVADELMMNALHDTPGASAPGAVFRWGADGRVIAISVADAFGALRQRDVVGHIRRARCEHGRPLADLSDQRGAGIGLYLVLANVTSLIVNVEVGRRTEVVCIFDRTAPGRRAAPCARSLHVFQAAPRSARS